MLLEPACEDDLDFLCAVPTAPIHQLFAKRDDVGGCLAVVDAVNSENFWDLIA